MKVKVTTEFKSRHTGELHKVGDILDLPIQRINEVLSVGNFIELIESVEQFGSAKNGAEQFDIAESSSEDQEESEAAGEQTEESLKQTGRRKGSK